MEPARFWPRFPCTCIERGEFLRAAPISARASFRLWIEAVRPIARAFREFTRSLIPGLRLNRDLIEKRCQRSYEAMPRTPRTINGCARPRPDTTPQAGQHAAHSRRN